MLTSKEYERVIQLDKIAAQKLLGLVNARDRAKYNFAGISTDTLAELVAAQVFNSRANDGNGVDLENGIEVKWSLISTTYDKNKKKDTKASAGNLLTKTGDLLIIIGDPREKNNDLKLRFFFFPFKIWKRHISGDKFNMAFGSDRWKWYMDYEYTWSELRSMCRGLERFGV